MLPSAADRRAALLVRLPALKQKEEELLHQLAAVRYEITGIELELSSQCEDEHSSAAPLSHHPTQASASSSVTGPSISQSCPLGGCSFVSEPASIPLPTPSSPPQVPAVTTSSHPLDNSSSSSSLPAGPDSAPLHDHSDHAVEREVIGDGVAPAAGASPTLSIQEGEGGAVEEGGLVPSSSASEGQEGPTETSSPSSSTASSPSSMPAVQEMGLSATGDGMLSPSSFTDEI